VEIEFDPLKSEKNLRERGFSFEMVADFDFGSALYSIRGRITARLEPALLA
jgi:uncharacterized DUF497 family protein